ncbi:SDR family oxidoreductase [Streptomyces sp. NPDC002088]|uniref:SDR family NAD(P)-dependent oxidoreductase n=1 Tax=Streptomyces sp. NPDC002088 TaxID=3154665 RepID=UPI0033250BC0
MKVAVDAAEQQFGSLDFAHNNAGIGVNGTVADLSEESWDKAIRINLNGVFYGMKYQVQAMRKVGGGAIVNTASMWGQAGVANGAAYSASKHGVIGLTRSAALDHAKEGIRVNAVAPGPIETLMTKQAAADGYLDAIIQRTATGQMGKPEDIAEAVVWLASDAARCVHGAVIDVDGGWLAG